MGLIKTINFYKIIFFILIFIIIVSVISCSSISQPPVEVDNYPPYILSDPVTTAKVGEEYYYQIDAYDVEGDILFYSLEVAPTEMVIDASSGMITWTPSLNQLGEQYVEVKVSDNNIFETQSFVITVYKGDEEGQITQISFGSIELETTIGSSIQVDLMVENVFHLKGASISFDFDATRLQYEYSTEKQFIINAFLLESNIDNNKGEVTIDIAGLGKDSYASGSGEIFTMTFNAISPGDTVLGFEETELRDMKNKKIEHNVGSECMIQIN